jgi:hypothetical protein
MLQQLSPGGHACVRISPALERLSPQRAMAIPEGASTAAYGVGVEVSANNVTSVAMGFDSCISWLLKKSEVLVARCCRSVLLRKRQTRLFRTGLPEQARDTNDTATPVKTAGRAGIRFAHGTIAASDHGSVVQCVPCRSTISPAGLTTISSTAPIRAPFRAISDASRSIEANAAAEVACSLITVTCRALSRPYG